MANIASLTGTLTLDNSQFEARLNASRRTMDSSAASMQRGLKSVDGGFSRLSSTTALASGSIATLARSILPVLGAAGLAAMTKQALETVGGLGELASQLGVTTDLLQVLTYAGTQYGVSAQEIEGSLSKLTATIGAAAEGGKSQIEMFDRLGIKILDASGKVRSTDVIFRELIESLSRIEDPATRAALAKEAMGRAAQRMMPLIEGGTVALDAMTKQAKEMGLVFDAETIRAADDAADKIAVLSRVLGTQFNAVLVQLAPILTAVAQGILDFSKGARETVQAFRGLNFASIDTLNEKLTDLQKRKAELQKQDAEGAWWENLVPGFNLDPEAPPTPGTLIQRSGSNSTLIAQLDAEMTEIQAIIRRRRDAADQLRGSGEGDGQGAPPIAGGGQSDAEKNLDALQKKLGDLQAELDQLHMGGLNAEIDKNLQGFDLSSEKAKELAAEIAIVTGEINAKTEAQKRDAEASAEYLQIIEEATESYNKRLEEGRQITEALRTPQEVYRDRVAEINQLHRDGAINTDTWARGLEDAKETLAGATEGTERYESAMADLGATFGSAFEEAALSMDQASDAADALGDMLMGLLQDIERIILRVGVTDPLAAGLGDLFKNMDWSWLFGAEGLGSAGAPMNTTGSSVMFHDGGIVGGPARRRSVPAFAFAGAPRLHGGGFIGPGEVPAILRRGEGVFTPEQMAAMGSGEGDVKIVVNNYSDEKATASSRRGANGIREIEIQVGQMVAKDIRSGGPIAKSIGDRFGASTVPQVRRS
jgi:hypothetical protein